jgi:hypothetical protein
MGIATWLEGTLGQRYEYLPVSADNLPAITRQRGNFVFARSTGSSPIVLYAGEAHCLRDAFTPSVLDLWKVAQRDHGANMLLIKIHTGSTPEERQHEVADLVEKHRPPLNGPDTGAKDRE